uniref:Dienelactone hydrolase domain-containing protein n=2 Tax=Lotharella globosa TaxID=91324 RepID=A0A7S3ZCA9_9EUKA
MPDFYRGNPWPLSKFPPSSEEDKKAFGAWWGKECELKNTNTDIREAVVPFIRKFSKGVKMASIGLLGFCWGGLMCFGCAGLDQTFTYSAIASIHGANLTGEMASKIKCPAMVCPSKDDPPYDDMKKALDGKPFAKHCVYHNFTEQIHGFCAARGDWTKKETKADVDKALDMAVEFFGKMADYE